MHRRQAIKKQFRSSFCNCFDQGNLKSERTLVRHNTRKEKKRKETAWGSKRRAGRGPALATHMAAT
jgi:hypothetical protein